MGNSKKTKKRFLRVRGGARVRIRRTRVRASPERNASASTDRDTTAPSSRHCAEYEVSSPSLSSDSDDYEDYYARSRHEQLEVQASVDAEESGYQSDGTYLEPKCARELARRATRYLLHTPSPPLADTAAPPEVARAPRTYI